MTGACLQSVLIAAAAIVGSDAHGGDAHGVYAIMRDLMAGGEARGFIDRLLGGALPDIDIHARKGPIIELAAGVKEQTFLSPPMVLGSGEIFNKFMPIDWPAGHIAVTAFTADVVKGDAAGNPPPVTPCCGGPHQATREEVFLHHWTVNKWQMPGNLYKKIVKEYGVDYKLNLWNGTQGLTYLLADAGLNQGANGPCWDSTLHTYFGVGNEVRGRPTVCNPDALSEAYEFPDPYAVVFDSEEMKKKNMFMVMNNHVIDLRNVTNKQGCFECHCDVTGIVPDDPRYKGGLSCCHSTGLDGSKCPVDAPRTNITYFIRYTVKFREYNPVTVAPLEVITLEITDNNTKWNDVWVVPGGYAETHAALKEDTAFQAVLNKGQSGEFLGYPACHVEYRVPPCAKGDTCVHKVHNSWEVPFGLDIVFVRNHMHGGGINVSTWTDRSHICTGNASYDAKGMLCDMSTCKAGEKTLPAILQIEAGERITVEAVYSQEEKPRLGVMAFSVIYAHRRDTANNAAFHI